MKTDTNNPLGIDNKQYTVEEFATAIRSKFGANDSLPSSVLVDIFIKKYPMYSCKIKRSQNEGPKTSCNCC